MTASWLPSQGAITRCPGPLAERLETRHHTRGVAEPAGCFSRTLSASLQLCRKCNDAPLGCAGQVFCKFPVVDHTRTQKLPDEVSDVSVRYSSLHGFHQPPVRNRVEGFDNSLPLSTTHSMTIQRSSPFTILPIRSTGGDFSSLLAPPAPTPRERTSWYFYGIRSNCGCPCASPSRCRPSRPSPNSLPTPWQNCSRRPTCVAYGNPTRNPVGTPPPRRQASHCCRSHNRLQRGDLCQRPLWRNRIISVAKPP